jgi:hypothetical protein
MMTTAEERLQILKMVAEGKITAEQGADLLEAVDKTADSQAEPPGGEAKWFRVRVTDLTSGKPKVNVNIPLGLVSVGVRMGAKFAPEMSGIDIDEILRAVREGTQGRIVDVENQESDERVEIYVE